MSGAARSTGHPRPTDPAEDPKFPHLQGKPPQEHHVHPKYLGGPEAGPTVKVDPAYHQLITHEFRREYGYNQKLPDLDVQEEIMKKVYSKYPLPGVHL